VTRILAVGAPHRIVLLGWRARGDARSDNVLDFLIVEVRTFLDTALNC
jgi:hypothetical protein